MSNYTINHIEYSYTELLQQCNKASISSLPDWETEVWTFILEWFNDEEHIQLQTSGSTGTPKSISIEKKYLRNSAKMTLDFLGLKKGDTALLCLSASYIAGKMMIVRALEGGLNLLLKEAVGNPLKACSENINFAAMVPLQVEKVIEEEGLTVLEGMDHVIIGGAAESDSLAKKLKPLTNAVWSTYAMTETVSHVAMKRLSGISASDDFTPMPSVSFSKDDRGCLQIVAPHLCADTVVTNDLVELHSNQSFKFLGRYDNVINSGGVKISPEKVEHSISHFIKERFFITSIPDERLGNKLVLVIESEETYNYEKLKLQMKSVLNPYECPHEIFFMPHFRETDSGKVKRIFDII